ncbi:MAG: tryptophanase, partial [candidate division WOR-3 bacterium]
VEPIPLLDPFRRRSILRKSHYNPFLIPSRYVSIDLISDSGTSAMSSEQWARLTAATESFAFQDSYEYFVDTARRVTGFRHILPVHQGRAAEHILFQYLLKPGDLVLGNNFFETTEENIKNVKAVPFALPDSNRNFPGNMNISKAKKLLQTKKVKMVLITITSNTNGGQPVSHFNIKEIADLTKKYGTILLLDACRFAENGYFNKIRLKIDKPVTEIVRSIFDRADYIYLSNKKDGLANTGGFIGMRDKRDFDLLSEKILLYEGFPSHGGNTGRDLAAMAQGLIEAIDESNLDFRIGQVRHLGEQLKRYRIPVFEPFGGHAIVIHTDRINVPYPGFALAGGVYLEGGIRGGVFGNSFRLAVPRRVYTNDHLSFVASIVARVYKQRKFLRLKAIYEPTHFFNFWVRFQACGVYREIDSTER